MLTSEDILKMMEKNMDKIKEYGVERIGLFGSYTRGKQRKGSDIDILVKFKKGMKNFDNYMGLKLFLEDILKCKVDLVTIETIKPDLKPYILKNVIYASRI